MNCVIEFNKLSKSQLKKFEKKISNRIFCKLKWFIDTGDPVKYAKKLSNPKIGTYRFRIGNYRVLFDVDKKGNLVVLYILSIKHRKQVYWS